jgi:trehalose 6-phosphate phosphatase
MIDGLRARLGGDLVGVSVFTDFDGVLSALVDDPSMARPAAGALEALHGLVEDGAHVTVVSGRPLAFLAERFESVTIDLVGLYGLEQRISGLTSTHPSTATWQPIIEDVADRALAELGDARVESKGVSLTLHYRETPELAERVEAWAQLVAAESGLEIRPARQSVELHPPIAVDKGTALRDRTPDSATAVVYLGDDVGDLPAFRAVGSIAGDRPSLRIVVTNDGVASELAGVGDVELASAADVVPFLLN